MIALALARETPKNLERSPTVIASLCMTSSPFSKSSFLTLLIDILIPFPEMVGKGYFRHQISPLFSRRFNILLLTLTIGRVCKNSDKETTVGN